MTIGEINKLCFDVLNYFDIKENHKDLYNLRYNKAASNKMEAIFSKLLIIVDSNLIKEARKDYIDYYYIFLFCIRYKQYIINKEDIRNIINSKYNADYYSILQMNMELDDEIVLTILDLMNEFSNDGVLPYDYRYHILRRKEICDETKEHVLNEYTKDELQKVVSMISDDVDKELSYDDGVKRIQDDSVINDKCAVRLELNRKLRG